MNQAGRGGVRFYFLAEAEHVNIDSAVCNRTILSPDAVEQLFAAKDDAGSAHEELQEAKLSGSESQILIIERHPAAGAVEFNTGGFERTRRRRGSAKLELDTRDDFTHEEGFDNVIVGAEFEADNPVCFRRARGQKDNRNLRELGVVPDGFADVEPVGIGQHDIEQNQIGLCPSAEIDRAATALRTGEGKTLLLQVVFQQRVKVAVVFDEKYFLSQVQASL